MIRDFELGLQILSSIVGRDDYEVLVMLNNLGVLYHFTKHYENSVQCLTEVI